MVWIPYQKSFLCSYLHLKQLCKENCLKEAVGILLDAHKQGVELESDAVAEVLLLCASTGSLSEGKQLHYLVKDKAVTPNRYLQNNLLNMYIKCGCLMEGRQVFDEMLNRDIVAWNAIIAGYAKSCLCHESLKLFSRMQEHNIKPNRTTFVCVLKACAPPGCLEELLHINCHVVECSLELDLLVGSALVEMYAKLGRISDALCVFENLAVRDVVSWTSVIEAYSETGHDKEAFQLFQQMLQEGVKLDKVIFYGILAACTNLNALQQGTIFHLCIINNGFDGDDFVGSALVTMYARCGSLWLARRVFEDLPIKDAVSWTALMSGHEQHGEQEEALRIYHEMVAFGVKPNEVSFMCASNACAALAALGLGFSVHMEAVDSGYELNLYVASALIDMYSKSGSKDDAQMVFQKLFKGDTVTWNAVIDGLGQHCHPKSALEYFEQMRLSNVAVDSMTFVGVLAACSHAGLVDEGLCYFEYMQIIEGIRPSAEHYACMVDMLSRAGRLEAALNFLQKLPFDPRLSLLTSLLSACRVHLNVDVAKTAAESMIRMEPQQESAFVLLSNIYALVEGKEQSELGTIG